LQYEKEHTNKIWTSAVCILIMNEEGHPVICVPSSHCWAD
jgi:hypothetical protein